MIFKTIITAIVYKECEYYTHFNYILKYILFRM